MVPFGGVGVMLAGVVASGVLLLVLTTLLARRTGWPWAATAGLFAWSLVCIALVTLVPANGAPGVVSAEGRLTTCSWDIGGPAPEGFWILGGGQRLLNTVVFLPSGALLVLVVARWRRAALALVPLGLVLLAAYSVGIEYTQLELARIDRACDVTDMLDNTLGAVIGAVLGVALLPLVRPWRWSRRA